MGIYVWILWRYNIDICLLMCKCTFPTPLTNIQHTYLACEFTKMRILAHLLYFWRCLSSRMVGSSFYCVSQISREYKFYNMRIAYTYINGERRSAQNWLSKWLRTLYTKLIQQIARPIYHHEETKWIVRLIHAWQKKKTQ